MQPVRIAIWGAGILAALIGALPKSATARDAAQGGGMPTYRIAITGSADATLHGTCWVTTGDEEAAVPLDGAAPLKREFEGESLRCQIVQDAPAGFLDVELTSSNGNRTSSRTQGAGSTIALSIR